MSRLQVCLTQGQRLLVALHELELLAKGANLRRGLFEQQLLRGTPVDQARSGVQLGLGLFELLAQGQPGPRFAISPMIAAQGR
ncbi:hypothetical protein D3C71_1914380 [compost metagenome]